MVGAADDVLLHLLELVDADDAACVFAIRARLAPEAGRPCGILDRQVLGAEYLAAGHASDRHLGGAHEIELVLGQGVGLVAAAWGLAVADEAKLLRHGRGAGRRGSPAADAAE